MDKYCSAPALSWMLTFAVLYTWIFVLSFSTEMYAYRKLLCSSQVKWDHHTLFIGYSWGKEITILNFQYSYAVCLCNIDNISLPCCCVLLRVHAPLALLKIATSFLEFWVWRHSERYIFLREQLKADFSTTLGDCI